MEFAILAERVDFGRQLASNSWSNHLPATFDGAMAGLTALTTARTPESIISAARCAVSEPQIGKTGVNPVPGEQVLAVGSHIFQEQVAKGQMGGCQLGWQFRDAGQKRARRGLVVVVRAGVGDLDLVEGQTEVTGLQGEGPARGSVNGHAVECRGHRGEDPPDVPGLRLQAQCVKGPRGVLAGGPGDEDWGWVA